MSRVVVVGSLNVDRVLTVDRIVPPGETVLASGYRRGPGGKGANQAVAAARYGAPTSLVGTVGDDTDGRDLIGSLRESGVEVQTVSVCDSPTGQAFIQVGRDGENAIVVEPGANHTNDPLDDAQRAAIAAASLVIAQLEVRTDRVLAAAECLTPAGLLVLNASPATELPPALWDRVGLLVVNVHEARALTGGGPMSPVDLALDLLDLASAVVVTAGDEGSFYSDRAGYRAEVRATRVPVVDTTAAGDTFCGVLAAAIAAGVDRRSAMELASAAAAVTVQRRGAVGAIPRRAEYPERDPRER